MWRWTNTLGAALVVGGCLLGPSAMAEAPTCESLDEASFRGLVFDAQAAIDRDDNATHGAIVDDILGRVPCLTFAPPPRLWADFLVGVSIAAFASGEDWQTPLGAAARTLPGVVRPVGGGHPIATWTPATDPPAPSGPVPEGAHLFVDGRLATELPPSQGMYLVQRESEGRWASLLLVDQPLSPSWLSQPIEVPLVLEIRGLLTAGFSGGVLSQFPHWTTDFVPDGRRDFGIPTVGLRLSLTYGVTGLLLEADSGWTSRGGRLGSRVQVAGLVVPGRLVFGVGVGVATVEHFVGGTDIDTAQLHRLNLAHLHGLAWLRPGGHRQWGGMATGAVSPALVRLDGDFGFAPLPRTPNLRLALTGVFQAARLVQPVPGDPREVTALFARAGVSVGWLFGEGP